MGKEVTKWWSGLFCWRICSTSKRLTEDIREPLTRNRPTKHNFADSSTQHGFKQPICRYEDPEDNSLFWEPNTPKEILTIADRNCEEAKNSTRLLSAPQTNEKFAIKIEHAGNIYVGDSCCHRKPDYRLLHYDEQINFFLAFSILLNNHDVDTTAVCVSDNVNCSMIYFEFCDRFDIEKCSITERDLARYAVYLVEKSLSIKEHLNAIALFFKPTNLADRVTCHSLTLVERGIRSTGYLKRKAGSVLPVTVQMLRMIGMSLNLNLLDDLYFWNICLLCYFSYCTFSDIFAFDCECSKANSRTPCLRIRRSTSQIEVILRRLIPHAKPSSDVVEYILLVPSIPNCSLCPTQALSRYLEQFPGSSNEITNPFIAMQPIVATPGLEKEPLKLREAQFLSKMKTCLDNIGIDSRCYSNESFRKGGAVLARCCPDGPKLLTEDGQWNPEGYQRYLDSTVESKQLHCSEITRLIRSRLRKR